MGGGGRQVVFDIHSSFSKDLHHPSLHQEDILKVVVDLPAERQRRIAEGLPKGQPSDYDTGKFECIADGFKEVKTPAFSGLKLELQVWGEAVGLGGEGSACVRGDF